MLAGVRMSRVFRPRSGCDSGVTIASQARARASSAGRPGHHAATQQVQVEVIDGLSGLGTLVDDQAVTIAIDLALIGNPIGDLKHPDQHFRFRAGDFFRDPGDQALFHLAYFAPEFRPQKGKVRLGREIGAFSVR